MTSVLRTPRLGRGLLPRLRLVDLRSHPSFDSTPWQYRAADNLQGGKVFGFMAKRLGEAAGPVAASAGTLMRGVARLDPASIIVVGLLVGGAYLAFFYTRKFVAYIATARP